MKKTLLLLSLAAVFAMGDVFAQGSTTASMRGRITDNSGEGLPGAAVRALHTPSGSEWGNTTDLDGYFRLPGLRAGGPYTVTISFVGFETMTKENVYLTLGQTFNLNENLEETATELEAIVISANQGDIFDGNRTGASTFIGTETINTLPNVGRSVGDFVRLTPQATINEGNDGLSISIGGQNNRYNAIYIDGAVNNDVFGLAGSGTNGGQTGVAPISIDAIEQFNISVAPFDVRQSGFAGGSVSAVTRSGTNDFEGSVYYFFRNENLAGKTPVQEGQDIDRVKLPEFDAQTYGLRVGGPIIKNKLFFFVNAELQRDENPQPFNLANYNGNATETEINQLVSFLTGELNFDPGTYTDNTAFLDSDKFLVKLDWNASANHKVSLRHSYNEARNLETRSSSSSGLRFVNGSEFFNSTTNSTSLELKSTFGQNISNHLTVGATIVRDDRDPYDNSNDGPSRPFPAVFIDDGRGGFTFGSETFSTANLLDQDVITINNNFEYYKGRHTFLAGVNLEFYTVTNLFIPFNYGDYGWERSEPINGSNLEDFIAGEPADDYIRSFSLRDNVTGDGSIAGVKFNGALYGFFLQDEYQATDNLKLTLGVRGDIQTFDDTPNNTDFNNRSIPLIEGAGYDLEGARTGNFIKPQLYVSPRFGFNWDLKGDQSTQLRGGTGIFTSRIPLVWPGGAFNNNGVNRGTVLDFQLAGNPDALRLRDWDEQPVGLDDNDNIVTEIDPNNVEPSGDIDIFAEDFRIPQVWKTNIAVDQRLPWGLIGTVEFLFTKNINQVYYQNVNLRREPVGRLEGTPDNRPIWDRRDPIDDAYGRIILGTNNSKGYAYNITASVTKPFENGFSGMLSYNYGDAYSIYDGTSSQNSSQWRGIFAVNGRNDFNQVFRSDFAQGHRILAKASYRKEYLGFLASQISIIYEGRSGAPFSWIYGNGQNLTNEDSRNRALVYIPRSQDEIVLVDTDELTAAQQWTLLDDFIENDPYLSEHRGEYADRNSNRSPFENIIDVKFLQDFYIETANGKRNTFQFTVDIFNFTNLLSQNWGKRYGTNAFGVELLEYEGNQDGTNIPTFSYTPFNDIEPNEPLFNDLRDQGLLSSRWQMQIGLRYIFN
ncbi:MAG: carboxypeptidase regulatory-like domain-containing protein [Bacteroidota bacterium]